MLVKVVDQQPTCFSLKNDRLLLKFGPPAQVKFVIHFPRVSASSGTQGFLFYFGGCGTYTRGIEVWLHCPYVCMGDERKQKRTVTHSSNPKREKEIEMEIKCWLGSRTDGDHTIIQTTKTKTINRGVSCSCEQN